MNGARARPPRSPQHPYNAHVSRNINIDIGEELKLSDSLARLCNSNQPSFAPYDYYPRKSKDNYPNWTSSSRQKNNKNTSIIHTLSHTTSILSSKTIHIERSNSRDPIELTREEGNILGKPAKENREDNRVNEAKVIRNGLRKENKQTNNKHSTRKDKQPGIQRSVSFANGMSGNAVTGIKHYYMLYSDEEKAACFYNGRDLRKFRKEHYLGTANDQNSQSSEYADVVGNDFLLVMNDMWNSFVDLYSYSLNA